MKKLNYPLKYVLLFTVILLGIVGCNKDNSANNELFIYTPPGNITADMNHGDFLLVRETVLPVANSGFPAVITRPFAKDVNIKAVIETSLLVRYDSINGTNSPAIPDGLFRLKNDIVTIKAGETASADSFYLDITDVAKIPSGINSFIIPVEIRSENPDVQTSTVRNVMYLNADITTILSSAKSFGGSDKVNTTVNFTPVGIAGPDEITFGAFLNRAIPQDAKVTVELAGDNEVDDYNQANSTSYKHFPAGTYLLSKSEVTVPAGTIQSADSFAIDLTNLSEFEIDESYLLVLKVKDEGLVAPDADNNKVYVIVKGIYSNIDLSNTSAPASLLDRSGWSVAARGGQTYGAANNALDNNYNTSWMTPISNAWITIDMGAETELSGIQLSPNYAYGVVYNTTTFEVLTSVDNINWQKQGTYTGNTFGGSTSNPDIRNVHFYGAVNARYFKINYLNINSSGYAGASEIKGF